MIGLLSGAVHQAAEIAVPHGLGRHLVTLRGGVDVPQTLERKEPECLVAAVVNFRDVDGPAGAHTELVPVQKRRLGVIVGPRSRQADGIVPVRLKGRAMQLVSATLGAS